MIRVIIERRPKKGQDLSLLLRELRVASSMHYRGFVSAETLVSIEDGLTIMTISTWQSLEDWERWAASETRAKIYQQIEPLLLEKPKVRIFQIMATEQT